MPIEFIQIPLDERSALYQRMANEEVIFYDDFEDLMVRLEPISGHYFVKRKGTAEFRTEHSSKLVAEAIRGGNLVNREQYDAY
jgi:hypothetical protein